MSRAGFRAHGFRAPPSMAASFPLKFQQKSGGRGRACRRKPTAALVKRQEKKQANSQGNQGAGTWD